MGLAVVLMGGLSLGAAPSEGGCMGGSDEGYPSYNQNNSSPTGTFLSPKQPDGAEGYGYEVLDEACEDVLDPHYLARFETPMFRGVAHYGGVAHLVDGSLLWSVSLSEPAQPERLARERLPGHPLKIAADDRGRLFVAAGEAGVLLLQARDATHMEAVVAAAAAGDATATGGGAGGAGGAGGTADATVAAPELVSRLELPEPALDVATLDATRFVVAAAGIGGLVVVDASDITTPSVAAQVSLPGFANAVTVDRDASVAWVAACRALVAVDVSDPYQPHVLGAYAVPLGHARGVAVENERVHVAGGEALFVYEGEDPEALVWTGYYAEPDVEGFYVNDVVVRGSIAYLAAGDEAVRAVDVGQLSAAGGFPAERYSSQEPPGLEEAAELPPPQEQPQQTIWVLRTVPKDPIAVGLVEDLLLVLGNFRWMGERTLRVMRVDELGGMNDLGAYIQPKGMLGVDAVPDHWLIHLGDGVERPYAFASGDPTPVALPELSLGSPLRRAVRRGDVVWLLAEDGALYRWSPARESPLQLATSLGQQGFDLAPVDERTVYLSDRIGNQLWKLELDGAETRAHVEYLSDATFPGYSYLHTDGQYVYVYEWVTGLLHVVDHAPRPSLDLGRTVRLGRCEAYDLADFFSGRRESRTRLLQRGDRLYVLCPEDEQGGSSLLVLDVHRASRPTLEQSWPLPAGRYVDLALGPEAEYLLTFDNNRYRSRLMRLMDGEVVSVLAFDGHANSIRPWPPSAATGDGSGDGGGGGGGADPPPDPRWLVIDGDAGSRLYEVRPDGQLAPVPTDDASALPGQGG